MLLVKLSMNLSRRTVALVALAGVLLSLVGSDIDRGMRPFDLRPPVEAKPGFFDVVAIYKRDRVLPVDPWKWDLNDLWGAGRGHRGIDVALRTGEKAYSVCDGKVVFSGWYGVYGNLVRVRFSCGVVGTEGWYAHLSKRTVKVGERVLAGDVVGLVGSTGGSTGPHLHFGITLGGGERFVDPLPWLRAEIPAWEWKRTVDLSGSGRYWIIRGFVSRIDACQKLLVPSYLSLCS